MSGAMTDDRRQNTSFSRTLYALYIAFVASIGGFLFGYDLVIISGAEIFIRDQFSLTPAQLGFATSSAMLGCIAGPIWGAWISDRFGRKATLLTAALLFTIGAVGTALAYDIAVFNVFRILGGMGVGLASLASPVYIAEVAPARIRGRLGLMYQLAITIGAVAATIVSYFLARDMPPTAAWRWMFASVLVPVLAFLMLLTGLPASPRWLAEKRRFAEALAILIRIGGNDEARKELAEIQLSMQAEVGSIRELFQPAMRGALATGVILGILNNWTGWTGIAFYLPTLFQRAGFTRPSDAIAQNVVVMAGTVLLTLISVWLIDRVGRRPLWLVCSAAMCIFLLVAGAVFQFKITGGVIVLVIFLCAAPHSIGLGPLPWLMMSEIYPTRVRARAVSLSTTILWVAAFTGPLLFPVLESSSEKVFHSVAGVFWLYSAVCLFSLLWGWRFLPETRGRTLEDIASSWKHTARP